MSTQHLTPRGPLPQSCAWSAVAHCFVTSLGMVRRREIRFPRSQVGRRIEFADGSSARVYRETTLDRTPAEPCFLTVAFRLRFVRGRGHALFRAESLWNTPLFVGFPGFVSKLWLTADERGRYRGLYEWDGADRAESYARSLWRVLELVSAPGSVDYRLVTGLHRDDVLSDPALLDRVTPDGHAAWWRVLGMG